MSKNTPADPGAERADRDIVAAFPVKRFLWLIFLGNLMAVGIWFQGYVWDVMDSPAVMLTDPPGFFGDIKRAVARFTEQFKHDQVSGWAFLVILPLPGTLFGVAW